MLGISAVIGGDFVFLPDDYRIKKVAPELWCGYNTLRKKNATKLLVNEDNTSFMLFLRIKFFMPANLSKAVKYYYYSTCIYKIFTRYILI